MIAVETFSGRRVAVFGLAGSGLVTAHALTAGGAEIVCFDDARERVEAAWDAGLPTGDLRVADFSAFDALILSPGVPLTHPEPHWVVQRAQAAGIEIIGDVELFDRERRSRFPGLRLVAVTGTNGKSTTTALLGHLLRETGEAVQVGGNIGRPVLDLDPVDGIAVVEVSSFQIDLSPTLTPDVGALLNVQPDHLDRHGTFENYAAVKERLVGASRVAVVGEGDGTTRAIAHRYRTAGKPTLGFALVDPSGAADGPRPGFAVGGLARRGDDGWHLVERAQEGERDLSAVPDVTPLRGPHNAANAAAALAVIAALGLDAGAAAAHLAGFAGLPHRMEQVGRAGQVVFVNDSKATNVEAAATALRAFRDIHWIAGGRPKPGGLAGLGPERFALRRAYLIGEAAEGFAADLHGAVDAVTCGTLESALDAAAADAHAAGGGVVLLSPAAASFDQFRSFEERGDVFRDLVKARLAGSGNAEGSA
jgi:UDP-N-acetylmuramoylalanine--D-glutamate ligase